MTLGSRTVPVYNRDRPLYELPSSSHTPSWVVNTLMYNAFLPIRLVMNEEPVSHKRSPS